MRCHAFKELMSRHIDGELPPDAAAAAAEHVSQCPDCAAEQQALGGLSLLAKRLDRPAPPARVWHRIEAALEAEGIEGSIPTPASAPYLFGGRRAFFSALAAGGAIAAALLFFFFGLAFPGHHHAAVDLGPFLDAFERSPQEAQRQLISAYRGRRASLADAVNSLPYRPQAADGLPPEYQFSEAALLDMPCCYCLEACYLRRDGSALCLFEHDRDQFAKFGERPTSTAVCCGVPTRLVHMGGRLLATWPRNGRFLTVIGAKDLNEVSRLILHFEQLRTRPDALGS